MGMFDSIHTGERCGQTKAFYRSLADICPGDQVASASTGAYAMHEGGWIVITDGRLVAWVDHPSDGMARFDNEGLPLDADLPDDYAYDVPTHDAVAARISRLSSHTGEVLEQLVNDAFAARVARATGRPGTCDVCARLRLRAA